MSQKSLVLVLLAGLQVGTGWFSRAEAQIAVGKNVQVSAAFPDGQHFELLANVDPSDPSRMIACSYIYPHDAAKGSTIVYSSFDGGKSWAPTLGPAGFDETGDPVCTFGNGGEAYYSMLGRKDGKAYTALYRSEDGGRTWGEPLYLESSDRQSITIDRSQSKYRGSIYINATGTIRGMLPDDSANTSSEMRRTALTVFYSRDGVHFGTTKRAELGERWILGMGDGAVLSDGSIIFIFGDLLNYGGGAGVDRPSRGKPNAVLYTVTSKDGGVTLDPPVKVSDFYMDWPPSHSGVVPYITADISEGPFKDRAYATWPDRRSGRDEIYVAHSDDQGKTWSQPVVVNDDQPWAGREDAPDHLLPVIGVNKDGVVGVMWNDRRDNPNNLGYWVRFSASLDGGDTWLPSVRVSEKPHAVGEGERWPLSSFASSQKGRLTITAGYHSFGFSGGHYVGMGVSPTGEFHPTWIDNRTGVSQIWTAPVAVQGNAVKHGSAELAAMTDVSDKVTLEATPPAYDARTGRLTMTAVLKNTSKDTIHGPVKVRVIAVDSDLGRAAISGADNGRPGPGAVWDLSPLIEGGVLRPDERSAPRQLTFTVTDLLPFQRSPGDDFRTGLIKIDARVLAREVIEGPKEAKDGGQER